ISGEIWVDLDGDDLQGGGDLLLLEEVVVNLYDYKGNHVNSVVTTTGEYEFDGLYLIDGLTSKYIVEFDLPEGYKFVVGSSADSTTNSDVVSGSRTYKVELKEASPTNKRIDAGVEDAEAVPSTNASIFQFGDSSFSASGVLGEEVVEVTVVRADAQEARAVVYNTLPGTGADAALPGVNYEAASGLLLFQIGELVKTFEVPVIPVLTLGICDTVHFNVFLREPTGRPVDEGVVYLYGDGEGELNDDDEIYGGDDWDLILGDSGSFRATDILTFPGALSSDLPGLPAGMVTRGGPGDDVISGGNSLDFIDAQLGDDVVYDGEGRDVVYLGLGDDLIDAQLDDDFYYGQHGSDVIISTRDMATIAVSSPTAFGWVDTLLEHKDEAGVVRSTFYLNDFESVRLYGGAQDNTFDLSGWNGGAFVSGSGGNDSLVIENDTDMTVVDSTLFEGILFQLLYGFFKQGAVLLPDSTSYHFGGIENVSLTGGAGDNTIDASGYSKGGITFEGKGGRDFLLGSQRNDVFLFDTDDVLGFDSVEGNGGSDTLDFSATSGEDIEIDLSVFGVGNIQTVVSGRLALELLAEDLEVVIGGDLDDTITGNTLDNVLHGGPGNDSLAGGAGSETYVFDTDSPWGIEQITENIADGGHDTLDFSGTSGFEIDLNMGILGTAQVINANLTLTLIGEGIEEVIGGELDDTIRGNSNENTLRGGPGADLLDGKSGDDFLDGGEGDDDLDGGLGYDSIDESGNTNFTLNDGELARGNGEVDALDDLEFVKLTGGISPNVFDLTGWSGDAELRGAAPPATDVALDRVVFGGDFSMVLTDVLLEVYDDFGLTTLLQSITLSGIERATLAGGDSSNQIDASGFTGTTRLSGKGGDDTIVGGSAYDRIDGGAGDDTLTGNLGNDRIIGGPGTDGLAETRNANFITGAGGIVVIGTESDLVTEIENATLTGGASSNLFIVTGWDTGELTVDGAGGDDLLGVIADADLTATDAAVTLTDGALVTVIATSSFERVTLIGGNGDNSLDASGFSGRAGLGGGDGDDTITVGSGETAVLAGAGDDTVVIGPSGGGVNEVSIEAGEGDD
ncbi:MAG: hypothetical protein P8J87_21395, partial [Verrucomicrobiales bacterium]|nr:hypothetical protein [Verrucomicrobiales bacterium]